MEHSKDTDEGLLLPRHRYARNRERNMGRRQEHTTWSEDRKLQDAVHDEHAAQTSRANRKHRSISHPCRRGEAANGEGGGAFVSIDQAKKNAMSEVARFDFD